MSKLKGDGMKMPKYIDAEKALDRMYDICAFYEEGREVKDEAVEIIADFPAADVQEVKHGYWIDTTAYCGEFTCSICKETCVTNKYKYCPHCGAKMDGKDEENDRNKH